MLLPFLRGVVLSDDDAASSSEGTATAALNKKEDKEDKEDKDNDNKSIWPIDSRRSLKDNLSNLEKGDNNKEDSHA